MSKQPTIPGVEAMFSVSNDERLSFRWPGGGDWIAYWAADTGSLRPLWNRCQAAPGVWLQVTASEAAVLGVPPEFWKDRGGDKDGKTTTAG